MKAEYQSEPDITASDLPKDPLLNGTIKVLSNLAAHSQTSQLSHAQAAPGKCHFVR